MPRTVLNISKSYNTTLKSNSAPNANSISGNGFRINGEGFRMNGGGFRINGSGVSSEESERKELPTNFRKIKFDKKANTKNNIRLIL